METVSVAFFEWYQDGCGCTEDVFGMFGAWLNAYGSSGTVDVFWQQWQIDA